MESNAIFAMVIGLKKLPKDLRNEIQDMFLMYLKSSIRQHKVAEGEK
ncbi:hypothetical protein H7142_00915 [Candidatus Saccharibacteria bacterium]|nr:hypothetical protein [Candidatus Saccharibacteria bacterium]